MDLLADEIEDIYPLGEKSWLNLDLDASDKDGGKKVASNYYLLTSLTQSIFFNY